MTRPQTASFKRSGVVMDFDAMVRRLELEAQGLRETIAVSQSRLDEIEMFLKLGRKLIAEPVPARDMSALAQAGVDTTTGTTRRDRVLIAAEKILSDGRRRSTPDLLKELHTFGVSPGGADPVQSLSTYLSRAQQFCSDGRRGGWTLTAIEQKRRQDRGMLAMGITSAHGAGIGDVSPTTADGGSVAVVGIGGATIGALASSATIAGTWYGPGIVGSNATAEVAIGGIFGHVSGSYPTVDTAVPNAWMIELKKSKDE